VCFILFYLVCIELLTYFWWKTVARSKKFMKSSKSFDLWVCPFNLLFRSTHQGWMIHRQEHLNGVPPIHFRYLDHVHVRYVMSISTEADQMVGSLTPWRFLVIIRGLLLLPTIPTSPEMFGTDLICATMPLLHFSEEFRNGFCTWSSRFLLVLYCKSKRIRSSTSGTIASNLWVLASFFLLQFQTNNKQHISGCWDNC